MTLHTSRKEGQKNHKQAAASPWVVGTLNNRAELKRPEQDKTQL